MKKLLTYILFLFPVVLVAQQTHQYTQYMFNQFGHNPAVAGSKECTDIKLGYRMQWVGFEGAPTTGYASFHTRLGGKNKALGKGYHGIGVYLENDQTGPLAKTQFYPAYAYHQPINRGLTISGGLFTGFQQYIFDRNVSLYDPNDNAISNASSVFILPDLTAGVWLYGKHFYGGFAARQVLTKKLSGIGGQIGSESRLARHYNVTAGYRFRFSGDVSLIPSAMLKFVPMSPPSLDLNALMDIRNIFSFGISYRNVDALAALVKISLARTLDLGYSYDLTTSKIRTASSNTHEITLGLYICGKGKGSGGRNSGHGLCPAYN
jgi:type IX secretion system PorP/SprF family membrane protein